MIAEDTPTALVEGTFKCHFCPFSTNSTNSNLKIHIENIHYEVKHKCDQCDMHFNSKQILAKHIARLHQGKGLSCGQCSFSAASMTKVREHEKVKHEGIWYRCEKCDFQSPNRTGLKKHDNVKHKGLVPAFKCEFCPHVATEKGNLRQHIRSKHEHVKETCSQCDLSFSSPQNLRKHKQSVHEGIRYSCDQCDFKTADKIKVRKHTESKHEGKVYKCDQCDYTSSNETRLKHHIKYRHEGLTFDCDQCDFKGASSGSLSRHTASIHEHRKFYCTACDYKCSDSTLLKRHVISKHKLYACELCDFQVSDDHLQFKIHKLAKHDEKPVDLYREKVDGKIFCSEYACNFSSSKSENILLHWASHVSGEKVYFCDTCDYTSKTMHALNNHVEKGAHIKALPTGMMSCTKGNCTYQSKEIENMKMHENSHNTKTKYPCDKYDCEYVGNTLVQLKDHSRREHENVRHTCKICGTISKSIGSLNRHMRTVHDDGTELSCSLCGFTTRREDSLKNHMKIEHEGVRYNCESCKFVAKCPQYLSLHKKVVHEGFRYKCDHCDYKATQLGQLYAHRKKIHGLSDHSGIKPKLTPDGPFKCCECSQEFPAPMNVRDHQLSEHDYLACNHCSRVLKTSSSLRRHLINSHGVKIPKEEATESEVKKCPECDYVTANRTNMKNHKELHTGELFKCNECQYEGTSKIRLRKHNYKMHKQNPLKRLIPKSDSRRKNNQLKGQRYLIKKKEFVCSFCQFKSGVKGTLDRHIRLRHIEEEKKKCTQCDYVTANKTSMKSHMDVHSGKSFNCGECDYQGTTEALLRSHKRHMHKETIKRCSWSQCEYQAKPNRLTIHVRFRHEGKSFDCEQCDYKGATSSLLKVHVEGQHSKTKIFKCDQCTHTSSNFGNLRKHKLYIHNKNRYTCNQCDYKTITIGMLNGHKKAMHKDYSDILSTLEEKISTFDENKRSENLLTCEICKKVFEGRSKFTAHKKRCTRRETVINQCIKCSFTSETARLLSRHYIKTHQVKKFQCDKCEYKTYLKSLLKRHKGLKHKEGEQLKCLTCDFETAASFLLKSHIEKNHKAKIFSCGHQGCSYVSRDWDALKEHKNESHEKVFFCSEFGCEEVSNSMAQATAHAKSVHGQKETYRKISSSALLSQNATTKEETKTFEQMINSERIETAMKAEVELEGIGDSSQVHVESNFTEKKETDSCTTEDDIEALNTVLEIGNEEISEPGDHDNDVVLRSKASDVSLGDRIDGATPAHKCSDEEAMSLFGEDAGPLIKQQDSSIGELQFRLVLERIWQEVGEAVRDQYRARLFQRTL